MLAREQAAINLSTTASLADQPGGTAILSELTTARNESRTQFASIAYYVLDRLTDKLGAQQSQLESNTAATTSLAPAVSSITSRLDNLETNSVSRAAHKGA